MQPAAFLLLAAISASAAPTPPPAAPPDLRDLAGHWVADAAYRTILEKRSPHAAVAETVTITAASASAGRLDWNNGHEGSWRRIVRLEPGPAADRWTLVVTPWEVETAVAAELLRVPLRLERDTSGQVRTVTFLDGALVQDHETPWTRLAEPVETALIRALLAGSYHDAQGRTWTFTPEGRAVWPDRSFSYELSTDAIEADCDYIFHPQPGEVGETRRYGFRWKGESLTLYEMSYPTEGAAPIHCDRPLAELAPQPASSQ